MRGVWSGDAGVSAGDPVCLAIRAERVRLGQAAGTENTVPARTGATIYKGKYLDQTLETDIGEIKARIWDRDVDISGLDRLGWQAGDCAVTRTEA